MDRRACIMTALLAALLASRPPTVAAADLTLSLTFDTDGTTDCRPDVKSYPCRFAACLLLRGDARGAAIARFTATLDCSPGLTVVALDAGRGGASLGGRRDLRLDYRPARPCADGTVLAIITFVARGPGSVTLRATDVAAPPGGFAPRLRLEGGPRERLSVDYAVGGPFHPMLTVGVAACPQRLVTRQPPRVFAVPETSSVATRADGAPLVFGMTSLPEQDRSWPAQRAELLAAVERRAWVALGQVISRESRLVRYERREAGLAVIRFRIVDPILGAFPDTLEVWAEGVQVPGGIRYVGAARFSKFDQLAVGREAFVSPVMRERERVAWVNDWSVFPLSELPAPADSVVDDLRREIASIERGRSPRRQGLAADLVALVGAPSSADEWKVAVSYHGGHAGERIRIARDYPLHSARSELPEDDPPVLCFLKRVRGQEYALLQAGWSAFAVAGDRIEAYAGRVLGPDECDSATLPTRR
ncbi:MAG: hypothetical protein ACYDIE_09495 [Candidatus Krumholzibacteriia bacterium]